MRFQQNHSADYREHAQPKAVTVAVLAVEPPVQGSRSTRLLSRRFREGRTYLTLGPEYTNVQEYERKQLLERIRREGATVGASIPETIEVQGEPVDLREFVFEIKRRDTVPPGERDRVERAKKNLRRERLQRIQRIEDGDVSHEEGERLADSIVGIDRALNALEQLGSPDLEQEAEVQEMADRKRWMSFLRKVLGHDSSERGIRR